ncbi:MAG: type II toxin-antitoxin system HicB family antitoxin [Candidatus Blackburnbacteria bacterium]|nr:type II toxin-antitoxin system HicB family antitoxin [Candidatus Blackburnbacteria bacterium]
MPQLNYNISLHVLVLKEGKHYVAYTPALDLATSGKTFGQAKKRFAEVVEVFLEELSEKGTLNKVLSELGWQKQRKEWVPPIVVESATQDFTIHPTC